MIWISRASVALIALCAPVTLSIAGCTGPASPSVVESMPPTVEGLREVESRGRQSVFLKPGVRLKDFRRILVDPFMVSYANPEGAAEGPVRTLDAETEQRLADVLRDAFIAGMQNSRHFDLVEQPGPNAVRVQGWLYDLVVEQPRHERARNFPLCMAQMTVILTVRHSETAQSLARVSERIGLSCSDEGRRAVFHTERWRDLQDAVTPWARFLRRWLEDLREAPLERASTAPSPGHRAAESLRLGPT